MEKADSAIMQFNSEYREASEQYEKATNSIKRNQFAARNNSAHAKLIEAAKYREECEKNLQKLSDPRDDYIQAALTLGEKMEAAVKAYEALGADDDVKAALAKMNETATLKVKLGPSSQFTKELPYVRKQYATINSAAIKLRQEGGVTVADVMINGKSSVPMIVDSGAASVALSAETAKKLGLKPGPNDATIKMMIANGKTVNAKLMKLDSVRLGQFTVENVLCTVADKADRGSPDLLGGTFLRHFVVRMDLSAGELHLTQLSGKRSPSPTNATTAAATPTPATQAASDNDTEPESVSPSLSPGDYTMTNKNNRRLTIRNNNRGEAATLDLNEVAPVKWKIEATGEENFFRIVNASAQLDLGVRENKTNAGIDILQWTRSADELGQQWSIVPVGKVFAKIVNRRSDLCLSSHGEKAVTQDRFENKEGQLWRFTSAAGQDIKFHTEPATKGATKDAN
jgi:aspartyl protease family protein